MYKSLIICVNKINPAAKRIKYLLLYIFEHLHLPHWRSVNTTLINILKVNYNWPLCRGKLSNPPFNTKWPVTLRGAFQNPLYRQATSKPLPTFVLRCLFMHPHPKFAYFLGPLSTLTTELIVTSLQSQKHFLSISLQISCPPLVSRVCIIRQTSLQARWPAHNRGPCTVLTSASFVTISTTELLFWRKSSDKRKV